MVKEVQTQFLNTHAVYDKVLRNDSEKIVTLKRGGNGDDVPLGNCVSVVIGNKTREDCKIVSKCSEYYTIQIPVDVVNSGEIVVGKTFAGAAADAAAKVHLLDRKQLSIVHITTIQRADGAGSQGQGGIVAAYIIAKEDKSKKDDKIKSIQKKVEMELH